MKKLIIFTVFNLLALTAFSQTAAYKTKDTCKTIKYRSKIYSQCFDRFGRIMSDGYYKNGKKVSAWRYYHDGFLLSKGTYKNDLRNGKWYEFYLDGTELFIGHFINGKRNGKWKVYKSDFDMRVKGSAFTKKLIEIREYKDDTLVKTIVI